MDTLLKVLAYVLLFWLGAGLYAAILTIPFRITGTVNRSVFNALLLPWIPMFLVIVLLWKPI